MDARKCSDVNAINLLGTLHFNIHPGDALPDLLPFLPPAFSLAALPRIFLVLVFPLALLLRATPRLIPLFFSSFVPHAFPGLSQLLCAYLSWWNRDDAPRKLSIITVCREPREANEAE